MPPRRLDESWKLEEIVSGGNSDSDFWVFFTELMVTAVARTNANVGKKALNIKMCRPPFISCVKFGHLSKKAQANIKRKIKIKYEDTRSLERVRQKKPKNAITPKSTTQLSKNSNMVCQIEQNQARQINNKDKL